MVVHVSAGKVDAEFEGRNLLRNLIGWTLRRERWGASLFLDVRGVFGIWVENQPRSKARREYWREGSRGQYHHFSLGKWSGNFAFGNPLSEPGEGKGEPQGGGVSAKAA